MLVEKLAGQKITSETDYTDKDIYLPVVYVESLRAGGEGQKKSFAAHREAFEEFIWNTKPSELEELIKASSFFTSEEDEVDEAKKD